MICAGLIVSQLGLCAFYSLSEYHYMCWQVFEACGARSDDVCAQRHICVACVGHVAPSPLVHRLAAFLSGVLVGVPICFHCWCHPINVDSSCHQWRLNDINMYLWQLLLLLLLQAPLLSSISLLLSLLLLLLLFLFLVVLFLYILRVCRLLYCGPRRWLKMIRELIEMLLLYELHWLWALNQCHTVCGSRL